MFVIGVVRKATIARGLLSTRMLEFLLREHQTLTDNLRGSRWARAQNHSKDFISWFEKKVMTEGASDDHIVWLAKGPNPVATKYGGYVINGYRFHTRMRDARCEDSEQWGDSKCIDFRLCELQRSKSSHWRCYILRCNRKNHRNRLLGPILLCIV
ncbi:hypothetical protein Dimus_031651 [Dionaea muscipula]